MSSSNSYFDLISTMALALYDAERMTAQGTPEYTSEDVRAIGITLFIEMRRAQLVLPDKVRFIARCHELLTLVGEDKFQITLQEFGATAPTEVNDVKTMAAIINSLTEDAASQTGSAE